MSWTDDLQDQELRLQEIEAAELELAEGPDAALKFLGPPTDPARTRLVLGILIRSDRYREAADLVRSRIPDPKWIDLAAFALARVGDFDAASKLVDRTEQSADLEVMRRTRVAFAEGIVSRWVSARAPASLLGVPQWPEEDVTLATTVLNTLEPLLALIRANHGIQSERELSAVSNAVYCSAICRAETTLLQMAKWLTKYVPVPMLLAELTLRHLIDPESALPSRLRIDYPGEFQPHFLAALLDRDVFDRPDDAFRAFVGLEPVATSEAEKEAICVAIFETFGRCSPPRINDALTLIQRIRPYDTRMLGLLRAFNKLLMDDTAAARNELEGLRNDSDGVWWQAWAQYCETTGDYEGAQAAWTKASELLPHPDVVRRSVQASLDRRRYESAVAGLQTLLKESPNNEPDLKRLAFSLIKLGDYVQAADCLRKLVEIAPTTASYILSFAQCLARTNRSAEALSALRPLTDDDEPDVQAVLLKSELLAATDRSKEAFDALEPLAADNWDDPQFVSIYLRRAHGAGKDEEGSEALARLIELRRAGAVAPELMQEGTLEQLLEYGREYQSRREMLQLNVLRCQLPWLFAEDVLGNAPTWAWKLHTQPLRWLSEEPSASASCTIYATNGFAVLPKSGVRHLTAIRAAPAGVDVTVDLTALVTLNQLNRLESFAAYFRTIRVPMIYGGLAVRDAERFGQHQPSRQAELEEVRSGIERGAIHVLSSSVDGLKHLDEYGDDGQLHFYRIQDLIDPLSAAQKLDPAAERDLQRIAHRPPGSDDSHAPLAIGTPLLVDLSTLRTLGSQRCFNVIAAAFALYLTPADRDELAAELGANERRREAKQMHERLWEVVGKLEQRGKLTLMPASESLETDGAEQEDGVEEPLPTLYLAALRLAEANGTPLVADDRVLQTLALHRGPSAANRAFGVDAYLLALFETNPCEADTISDDYFKLLEWRYRFLVPSSKMLMNWFKRAGAAVPGDRLLSTASYMHDCLRDPGLLCGLEECEPRMPMALKLLIEWTNSIVDFVALVWTDSEVADSVAMELTNWVGCEMLPSAPRGLWFSQLGNNAAGVFPVTTMSLAFATFVSVPDIRRANLGLRTLATALGLEEELYLAIAAEAIRVYRGH